MIRFALSILCCALAFAQSEDDHYRVVTLPTPDDVKFEVGGLALLPDGRMAAVIRKGEVWVIENPYEDDVSKIRYTLIGEALHEPLGLLAHEGDLYTTQRSELTRMRDVDGDGRIDEYRTVNNSWGVTGNYHEYAYGPALDGDGNFWVTLNQTLGPPVEEGESAWRGWGLRIGPDGVAEPMCAGMRSPCGIGTNALGDVFYTDQQGEWVPAGSLHHLRKGAFYGHAVSLKSAALPGSPIEDPGAVPSGIPIATAPDEFPILDLPAVWFPYRKAGMSATGIACDMTGGKFGPFDDQLFVGEFTMASVMRVDLEKVGGEYQGACFNFRKELQSAVVRLAFGADGSLFAGQTNRGWNSGGSVSYGLQRIEYTDATPFEMKTMRAMPDGFQIEFTEPTDVATASNPASYSMSSYTLHYHNRYGSEEIEVQDLTITEARVSEDSRTVHLVVEGLRPGFVHELHANGVRSADGATILHPEAYYTLNKIPPGAPAGTS